MSERHYFSNGTEGRMWEHNWCDRCAEEHEPNHGPQGVCAPGCSLILSMLTGVDEPELVEDGTDRYPANLHCLRFRRCTCDRGPDDPPGEKPPPPVDPNQGVLFDVGGVAMGLWAGVYADEFPPMVTAVDT